MEKVYGYEAPVVDIIEVEVEKGFACSPTYGYGESPEWNTDEIY